MNSPHQHSIDAAWAVRDLFLRAVRGIAEPEPADGEVTQAHLEEMAGRPLEETTAAEIVERLQGDPPGAALVVGFDRPQGPRHWVIGYNDGGTAVTIDPLVNGKQPFPPPGSEDAVRWFADGPPVRPFGVAPGSDQVTVGAAVLGIDADTARTCSRPAEDGLLHVWTPGRGGAHAVVAPDGQALAGESAITLAELLAAFRAGRRRASTHAVNHAASAVSATIDWLRGGELRTAGRTGPDQAALEAQVGGRLQETTADEIAERLAARPSGSFLLVGVDRAQGPGHWYVAMQTGEEIAALDPIANGRHDWPPPNADAVRWWADGEPLRPVPAPVPATTSEPVEVEARSSAGLRVWARVAPAYQELGAVLLRDAAALDAQWHKHGQPFFSGFWQYSFHDDGNGGLRLAAWNLVADRSEWDLEPALDVLFQERKVLGFTRAARSSVRFTRTFTVERGALEADVVHLVRGEQTGEEDSGWYVGTTPERAVDVETLTGKDLHRRNPDLARFLALPSGWHASWDVGKGRIGLLVDPDGKTVWDAAG
ncbi:toxin glutamine deamidase domain-containing protein [Antribacter gilvus]|uniref:immunity protein Imm33 domain-containing protein n=1 Tax=Antribacter gilvus TaxID=2304675 RepID=UPI000F795A9B|nr:toxin glutamine deamidase domain-containing protein [Antribacter gilvus]